jgi:site-specific DNA-methyltransferase (adenine-specific)
VCQAQPGAAADLTLCHKVDIFELKNKCSDERTRNATMEFENRILLGDCGDVLRDFPDNSIDLIFTSPPYADQRKNTYGGVSPDGYVDWFLPKAEQFLRVLKPTGTFILNIKERVVNGERHTYVIELILAMRRQGWLWTEEFMWHKKNSYPGKWPNRFRDNWERLIQFNKAKRFNMYQEAVMVPVGDWAKDRLANLSETDKIRDESKVGSGFGKNISNWVGRNMVYPNNVIHMSTECSNRNHSAAFPIDLPKWFIHLFTQPGDIVLDPFIGSGTTALAAIQLGRSYVGIDVSSRYVDLSLSRVSETQIGLPTIAEKGERYTVANGVTTLEKEYHESP